MKQETINRRIKEAKERNCEYLGDAEGTYKEPYQYGRYKFACGHDQDVKRVHFNAGKYRCSQCLLDKHENLASQHGLKILDHRPTDDADYKLYRLACSHTKLIAAYNLDKSSKFCEVCDEITRHESAERNGLELLNLEDTSDWMHRTYRYKNCGHTQRMLMSKVTNDAAPSCVICQRERWNKEAAAVGIELLELNVERNQANGIVKHRYKLPCGCEKNISTGCVRSNGFGCEVHSAYWSKKSVLYVLNLNTKDFNWLKVGVSSKLEKRVTDYKIYQKYSCDTLLLLDFKSLADATKVEKKFHKDFKSLRLPPCEMKMHKNNGTTECYPVSLQEEILAYLHEIKNRSEILNG